MNRALFAVFLAALVGGALPVFVKIGVAVIPPFSYTFLRFLIAGVCLLPIFIRYIPKVKGNVKRIIFLSLLPTINVSLFAFGIKHTSATVAQTLYATTPFFTAILSIFFLSEKLNKTKVIGLLIGFAGVALIINIQNLVTNSALRGELIGNLIIVIGVLSYCLYQIYSKKLQKDYKPIHLTIFFFTTAIISQGILSTTEISHASDWIPKLSPSIIGTVLYVGIIGTALYYFLNQYAIKHGSPIIASLTLYLQPVFTFLWARMLLGEKLTANLIIGGFFVFTGVVLVASKK